MRHARRHGFPTTRTSAYDLVLAEVCEALFASLPRSDQRRRGAEYIRGLLGAEGRKSIRNIATLIGGSATEQSLHHFISDSTWDWDPVRQALARYLARTAPAQAWVVRPMVIPKAGVHSVGVGRRYSPGCGQALNAQQAIGIWTASEEMSSPVSWRLQLSEAWLEDERRRSRASIPDHVATESLADCAVQAYLDMPARRELPVRPVVMDARELDTLGTIRRLRAAGAPLLVRISSTSRLIPAEPPLAGRGGEGLPAHQLIGAVRDMRRPVAALHHGAVPEVRTSLVATTRVRLPHSPGQAPKSAAPRELTLFGVGEIGQNWPAELWLTDLTAVRPAVLLRLSRLIQRVDRDFVEIADQVGIRDFAGRSFTGWHRHVTLASAAHAVAALTFADSRQMSVVC